MNFHPIDRFMPEQMDNHETANIRRRVALRSQSYRSLSTNVRISKPKLSGSVWMCANCEGYCLYSVVNWLISPIEISITRIELISRNVYLSGCTTLGPAAEYTFALAEARGEIEFSERICKLALAELHWTRCTPLITFPFWSFRFHFQQTPDSIGKLK